MTALDLVGHLLPKDEEHSKDCLYVIEPRYYGKPDKEKYCNCGAFYINSALSLVREALKKEVVVDERKMVDVLHDAGFYKFIVEDRIIKALASCPEKYLKIK